MYTERNFDLSLQCSKVTVMDDLQDAEMRCFHVSKGGVKYELILPFNHGKSKRRVFAISRPKTPSLIEIQKRQEQAATRRMCQRNTRIPSQHLNHIAEVRENRRKSVCDFRSTVKRDSDQKLLNSENNRENGMKSIQVMFQFM